LEEERKKGKEKNSCKKEITITKMKRYKNEKLKNEKKVD